jgi:hypothetical protein
MTVAPQPAARRTVAFPTASLRWIFVVAAVVLAVFAAVAYSNTPTDTLFNIPALTWVWAGVGSVLIVIFGVVL